MKKVTFEEIDAAHTALLLLMLCGVCLFLFFFRLAETGIMYPSWEPRRMLLAKDMVRNGHWLVPYLLGKPYVMKPPVLSWLISAGYLLVRSPSLWAARVPVALAGLINVLVTFLFAKKLFNQRVGFLAAWIFPLSLSSFYIFDVHVNSSLKGRLAKWANREVTNS